jgi:hypothetical protein
MLIPGVRDKAAHLRTGTVALQVKKSRLNYIRARGSSFETLFNLFFSLNFVPISTAAKQTFFFLSVRNKNKGCEEILPYTACADK